MTGSDDVPVRMDSELNECVNVDCLKYATGGVEGLGTRLGTQLQYSTVLGILG